MPPGAGPPSLQMISSPEPPASPMGIPVAIDGREAGEALVTWVIGDAEPEPGLKLMVTLPDGRRFEQAGSELFAAFIELRREKLDPLAIKLCCNGARPHAWVSKMVAELAESFQGIGWHWSRLRRGSYKGIGGKGPPLPRGADADRTATLSKR